MHDHALATTKPSKNNACFCYYYYLQGGNNLFLAWDRMVTQPTT